MKRRQLFLVPLVLLVPLLLLRGGRDGAAAAVAGPEAKTVLEATGVGGGLAVHLGSDDGRLESDLAADGRFLVHGLALGQKDADAARRAIQARGLYGVASVETWNDPPALPYADNLVNLVVADLDALGEKAPARAEILRVLCPRGVAYLRKGGTWDKVVKPQPADTDEWTHFDHGADGNGVSHDRRVRQPNLVQWVSGVQPIKLGGNPAAFVNLSGVRVAGGRAVFDYVDEADWKKSRQSELACRDAFSGVPLWTSVRDVESGLHRWQLVAVGDRVYTTMQRNGRLVALDARTGKPLLTFDEAPPITNKAGEATQVRLAGDTLLLNVDDTLYALDARTGKLRWKFTDESKGVLLFPSADAATGSVFVAVGQGKAEPRFRWPWATVEAVLRLELESGKIVWRNVEVRGKPVGQLVSAGDLLALFCGSAIGGREAKEGGGWVSTITVADGKLHGEATFKSAWNDAMYNAVVRDGFVWYAGPYNMYRFDPKAGQVDRVFSGGYNQRCNRLCATDELFLLGYVTYIDRDFNGTLQSVTRAGCALGATPANGMLYFTPNACNCLTQMRGYLALSPEPLRAPLPEARRLRPGDGTPPPAPPEKVEAPTGPLADDWRRQPDAGGADLTPAAPLGEGLSVRAVVQQHRVECLDDKGAVRWAFTAGGRVSRTPLVHEGTVYFGCHDGWVYALKVSDGSLRWRYLAAPYERKMSAYGQLESSWPVYGVTLHRGLLWASAGLHPEIGGGVFLVGLDPKTGEAKVHRTLAKSVAPVETKGGKTNIPVVPHSFLNDAPKPDGDGLNIGGFVFDPDKSDAELAKMLETRPPKKK